MKEVVIVSAARTAVGTFGGALLDIPAKRGTEARNPKPEAYSCATSSC